MTPGERIAAAARTLVGVPFRVQGRDPRFGLDCVGVAAEALRRAGTEAVLPTDYAMRSARVPEDAVPVGFRRCDGGSAGDILSCRLTPAQVHLAVRTASGFVHADLQARRVVERPGPPPWPLDAAWRWIAEGD